MATLRVKELAGSIVLRNYLEKKTQFEAIDAGAKKLMRVNRKIARKIMEDVLSRYDIEVIHRITSESADPIMSVVYRRKWRAR